MMSDLAQRFDENPILKPRALLPGVDGMEVTCLLNPGVFRYRDKVRMAAPKHRILVFSAGLLLFFLGAVTNTLLFNAMGVLIFIGCLLLAKPLLDLAYFPMQLRAVDAVSHIEGRNECAYIFDHEFRLFPGRSQGCCLFLGIAYCGSGIAALKYALPVIALLQLLSIRVAGQIFRGLTAAGNHTSSVESFTASKMEA
jgi:hypothetical protein